MVLPVLAYAHMRIAIDRKNVRTSAKGLNTRILATLFTRIDSTDAVHTYLRTRHKSRVLHAVNHHHQLALPI
eukprot:5802076-Pleurochrysis_carterae.AAC.2